jgi:NTE family protein
MMVSMRTLLLACAVSAAAASARAECGGPDGRRVGLVLSGGGARGLAHVGVLEVLEDERIAVDCVAGTSMGAAIGSLWAAGYSAEQIEELVHSIDWQEVFSGRRVRALVPLSRRIDDVPAALRLRVDGLRPRLPPARDSDYRLNRLLFRVLAPASLRAGGDFDRLPLPFRTVTTDLETVQPVVLSRGSLPRAVRASMSPPVTVPTIDTGGRVLVDGGIVDNVPVDVARGMGAGVVIAVDVTSPPLRRDQWTDILGAGRQLIDALMREHAKRWAAEADLVVTPRLQGRGAEDFSDPEAVIEAGRQAARAALPRIRALAGTRPDRRPAAVPPSAPVVTEVVVRGTRRVQEHAIRATLGVEPRARLDVARVLRGFDRVWATGLFDTLWLDLEGVEGGARLTLEVRETVPSALEVGWAYDEADEVNAFARFRHRNLFGHGERFDLTLLGGARDSGARLMLLGDAPWVSAVGYLAGGQLAEERPVIYRAGQEIARASFSRDTVFAGVQAALGPDLLLQARIDLGRVGVDARQGLGPGRDDEYRMLRGLAAWDRLDDPELPESGAALTFRAERSLTGGEDVRDYWRMRADGRAAWMRGGFVLDAAALLALSGRDVPDYDLHRIGGPRYLPGRPREERWGRQAVGAAASVGRDVFGFRVSLEGGAGGAFDRREDIAVRDLGWGAGLGIARRTRLGPVILQAGVDEDGAGAVYLSVGRR